MADSVPAKRKPVANNNSPLNPASGKKALKTRLFGFESQTVATFIFQLVALIAALVFGAWAIKSYDATLRANDLQNSSNSAADQQASVQQKLAVASGRLAVANYCQQYGYPQSTALCDGVIADLQLVDIASAFFGYLPSAAPKTTSTSVSTTSIRSGSITFAQTSTKEVSTTIGTGAPVPSSTASRTARASDVTASSSGASASSLNLGLGAIAGIIAGGVAFVGMIIALIMFRLRKRREAFDEE
ncbi:hypothetical protein MMC30_009181 [Trapelia coarctata]|nr:hypothetical protein [Trapelia coarctata]